MKAISMPKIKIYDKMCRVCRIVKRIRYFYRKWDSADGKQSMCIDCNKKQLDKYRSRSKALYLKRKYGDGHDHAIDGGTCQICNDTFKKLVVDHDHKTNEVRGYLCRRCNVMLGMALDNTRILLNAIKYIVAYYERR